MILWPILNARIHSGDLMVTLDLWNVYSLSRWVHTLRPHLSLILNTGVTPETWVGETVDTVLTGVGGQTNGGALARRRVEAIPCGRGFEAKLIERDRQSTIGLWVSSHDNPKMIGCRGDAMRLNIISSWWSPMWSLKGIGVSVIAPKESIQPSITSTRIMRVILLLGMLCVYANMMSIKHDVAPESNKAFVFRVVEPHWRVIGSVVVEEVGLIGPLTQLSNLVVHMHSPYCNWTLEFSCWQKMSTPSTWCGVWRGPFFGQERIKWSWLPQ